MNHDAFKNTLNLRNAVATGHMKIWNFPSCIESDQEDRTIFYVLCFLEHFNVTDMPSSNPFTP